MIVECWGVVNDVRVDFVPVEGRPGYWMGYAPRVKGTQHIQIWAKNHLGAVGYLQHQAVLVFETETVARILLAPYAVTLIDPTGSKIVSRGGNSVMDAANIIFGEKRNISIMVKSLEKKEFDIEKATYILRRGDEIEASGDCSEFTSNFKEHVLTALIEPKAKSSNYILEFHYTINPEELCYPVSLRVC